jgi:hypothetical protein
MSPRDTRTHEKWPFTRTGVHRNDKFPQQSLKGHDLHVGVRELLILHRLLGASRSASDRLIRASRLVRHLAFGQFAVPVRRLDGLTHHLINCAPDLLRLGRALAGSLLAPTLGVLGFFRCLLGHRDSGGTASLLSSLIKCFSV